MICKYCGYDNEEGAVKCAACRNKLPTSSVSSAPVKSSVEGDAFERLVQEAIKNTVEIRVIYLGNDAKLYGGAGTGFIVDGGYIVTNSHVIEGEEDLTLCAITASFDKSIDPVDHAVEFVEAVPEADLAVFKFKGSFGKSIEKRKNFSIRTEPLRFGEEVYTIGNALGDGVAVFKGVVAHPNREIKHRGLKEAVQTSFVINCGNSGGPLLDMKNQVVGVATFSHEDGRNGTDYCIPAKVVNNLINVIKEEEE